MANQSLPLTLTLTRAYSRTDFTALRAFVQRVPPASDEAKVRAISN
jgi:hypothetical protein